MSMSGYDGPLYDAEGNEVVLDHQQQPQETHNVRQMRERLEALERENKSLSAVARGASFKDAGVDLNTPLGAFFAENFKGDVSDPTAVKAEWEKLVPAPVAPVVAEETEGTPVVAEPTGSGERAALAADDAAPTGGVDPRQLALDGAREIADSPRGTEENALAFFISAQADGTRAGAIPQADQRNL